MVCVAVTARQVGAVSVGYSKGFFEDMAVGSLRSAQTVVPMLMELFAPRSVLDVGCGVGSWLSVFVNAGIGDVLGLDGNYVDRSMLKIDVDLFQPTDLAKPVSLNRTFDLVLTVEVAEHLADADSATFVESLTTHGSVIVFSAAIPFQGGTTHVNEQWPSYWIDLFAKQGFVCLDVLRPRLWLNAEVDYWYAQNLLVFVSDDEYQRRNLSALVEASEQFNGLPLVHPGLHLARAESLLSPTMGFRANVREIHSVLMNLGRLIGHLPASLQRTLRKRG